MRRFLFLSLILTGILFTVPSASAAVISQLDDSAVTSANHANPNQWFEKGALEGTFKSFSFKHQRDSAFGWYQLFINECDEADEQTCSFEGFHQSSTIKTKATGASPRVDTWYDSDFSGEIIFNPDKAYRILLFQVDGKIYGSTASSSYPDGFFCDGQSFPNGCFEDADTLGDVFFELEIDTGIDTPVIIVPGIMGSRLNRVSDGEEIWPNAEEMDKFPNGKDVYLNELILEDDGTQRIGSEMNAINVIDQESISGFDVIFYGNLINNFTNQGYASGTTLFTVPYDWRLDIADEIYRLDIAVQEARNNSPSGKVNIVAHSMGGLLVKEYLNTLPDTSFVDKLIIAGVPQLGAPKVFKALNYGDNMGFEIGPIDILNPERIKIISQNMPGVYELLPSRRYLDVNGGYVKDFRNGVEILDYDESQQFMEDSGRNELLLGKADNFHQPLDNSSFDATDVYNLVGCQNPDTIGEIRVYEDGKYKITPTNGDGTVPVTSAFNLSSSYTNYFALYKDTKMNHTDLIRDDKAIELINNILNGSPSDFGSGISTSTASCLEELPNSNKIIFSSHSPVKLHVYNSGGEHLGPNPDGDIELEIPDSNYEIIEGNNFAFVPAGDYEIVLEATDIGEFDFEIEIYNGVTLEEKVTYLNIPIQTSSAIVRLTFVDINNDLTLELDNEGDNIVDESFQPNAILDSNTAVDITPPDIAFNMQDEVTVNSQVIVDFTVTDDLSGVEIIEADLDGVPVDTGDSVLISEIGEYTLTVRAVDKAGNPRTSKFTFNAVYDFGGFLPPIKNDGSGVYKLGRTIPIKFQLTNANGQFISTAHPTLTIKKISSGILGDEEVELSTISTNGDDTFRYDEQSNQYIYNLSTETMSVGTWRLKVMLDDEKNYEVDVSIRG